MQKINLKENSKQIEFWDRILKVMIVFLIISITSLFIVSDKQLEENVFIYPWLILFFIAILCEIVFTIGMAYHSYKLKRYWWFIVIIFLGTIFPIIFYFSILRKKLKTRNIE